MAKGTITRKRASIAILISTSKNTMSFLLLLMSSLHQNWRRGQNRFCLEARRVEVRQGEGWFGGRGKGQGGKMAQAMYAFMNKKKSKKIKENYVHFHMVALQAFICR
jgi:hypothetical protein